VTATELRSDRLEAPADPRAFYEYSLAAGFGDGLPLFPPTEDAVRELLDATALPPNYVLGTLAPGMEECPVEKVAVNAAMAGVTPPSFGYVIAALEAVMQPLFNWPALAATTSSVTPMLVVNGPKRAELEFDMETGCMGGAAGRGSMTVGRAVQLCLRNIGGQKVGVTSKSVFGQPARASGLCFGEWEEESRWPSLAQRRGFASEDEVVTVHGGKGTFPFADIHNDDARDLLYLVAKTVAFPLSNLYLGAGGNIGETVICVNPVWGQRFAAAFPEAGDAEAFVHEHAWQPIDLWPEGNQAIIREQERVDAQGRVHKAGNPEQYKLVVCGGRGSLHAIALPSWGESQMQSVAVRR